MKYLLFIIALLYMPYSLAQDLAKPWYLGTGLSSVNMEVPNVEKGKEGVAVYVFYGQYIYAKNRLKLNWESSLGYGLRWASKEQCDPTSCYEVEITSTDISTGLRLKTGVMKPQQGVKMPMDIILGMDYVFSRANLQVTETFVNLPQAEANARDNVHGIKWLVGLQTDSDQLLDIRMNAGYTRFQNLFAGNKRSIPYKYFMVEASLIKRF